MVIAIIGILVAMLLPAVNSAREAARRIQCVNNIRQMGLALHVYHDTSNRFPVAHVHTSDGSTGWGWGAQILPFVEQEDVQNLINLDKAINDLYPPNLKGQRTILGMFQCPSAPPNQLVTGMARIPGYEDAAESNYVAIATHRPSDGNPVRQGQDYNGTGVMWQNGSAAIREITDGTSKTVVVTEGDIFDDDPEYNDPRYCPAGKCHVGYMWPAWGIVTTFYGINSHPVWTNAGIQSHHPGGANFLFADVHVDFLSEDIDQNVLDALTTRAGGDSIGEY